METSDKALKVKHLEMIQRIIDRLASNSFIIKGWTITLTSALFALAAGNKNPNFVWIALIPAIAFWGLDAYYLRQERVVRAIYNQISLEFSTDNINSQVKLFSIPMREYAPHVDSWIRTLSSTTIVGLHLSIVVVIILVAVFYP